MSFLNCSLEIVDEAVLNKELVVSVVQHICSSGEAEGAILIFVAGLKEIRDLCEALKNAERTGGFKTQDGAQVVVHIYPLHSSLSSAEQSRIFNTYPEGQNKVTRKIVVSTNIAETSVTIPDVVFVIDTCRVKENRFDAASQLSVLEEVYVNKANELQRRGIVLS